MSLFQKKIGPMFLKEDSDAHQFIDKMEELEQRVSNQELKTIIQQQIRLAKFGLIGENNISFELKNSGMDMYILHDIYLEQGDLSAQIDYLVITRKCIYIIECKNLIGNIEIDTQGNFIRTYEMYGKKIKEGIYSPITQNQRHLEVLKNIRKNAKGNLLAQIAFEYSFDDNYKSLVVLSNPKTYLNARYAKKNVRDKVIRADQIISTMKELNATTPKREFSDNEMYDIAQFFLSSNISQRSDYSVKYEEMLVMVENQPGGKDEKICPMCNSKLVLRTATRGINAGNKFYGCSTFPKCRYIQNI